MAFEIPNISPEQRGIFTIDASLETRAALDKLPFIPSHVIEHLETTDRLKQRDVHVSVARIIASDHDMTSWAAYNSLKSTPGGGLRDSYEYAINLSDDLSRRNDNQPLKLAPFRDATGEVWCAVIEGTHRIIAAKSRGEEQVLADILLPQSMSELGYYGGNVLTEFAG